jgi:hypothetical protein
MAIVGRIEIRPTSSSRSYDTYKALVCRCLLCGAKVTRITPYPDHVPSVLSFCDCYEGPLQPIRMIPNDKSVEEHP